jgi:hypothetical protein
MKTKTFLLICLFLGIATTQLSAQGIPPKNGTGSVINDYYTSWGAPVFCDGVQVDCMYNGTVWSHNVDHFKNGVFEWENETCVGTATSCWTGETFTFKELDKYFHNHNTPGYGELDINTHIKGDKGSLYNISFIVVYDADWNMTSWTVKNATCTGNTK